MVNKDEILKQYLNDEIMANGDYVHRVEVWAGGAWVLIQTGNGPVRCMDMSAATVKHILQQKGVHHE